MSQHPLNESQESNDLVKQEYEAPAISYRSKLEVYATTGKNTSPSATNPCSTGS